MRTPKTNKATSREAHIRSLKVQPKVLVNDRYLHRSVTTIPYLRLMGKWLQQVGFKPGDRVSVTTEHECLIIRPER